MITLDWNYIQSEDRGTESVPLSLSPAIRSACIGLMSILLDNRATMIENAPEDEQEVVDFISQCLSELFTIMYIEDFKIGDLKFTASATFDDTKFIYCDGRSLLRSDYPDLFAALGTQHGSVDGTHFNIPDYRARVPMGTGKVNGTDGTLWDLGNKGGEINHTLTTAELPDHSHKILASATGASATHLTFAASAGNDTPSGNFGTFGAGSGTAHNNLQPFTATFIYIKALP